MLSATRTVYIATDTPATPLYNVWKRADLQGSNSALGVDIPGFDSLTSAAKGVYYVGIGSALIVASLVVWKVVDVFFGD